MNTINMFGNEYEFLSNFYWSPFVINHKIYNTNEHYFQAMKGITEEDREVIRNNVKPGDAKRAGRRCVLHPEFELNKDAIMMRGLIAKFAQHKALCDTLLRTGDAFIIEGNYHHDNLWGDCFCHKCKHIEGLNKLGAALMVVRNYTHEQLVNMDATMDIGDKWK